MNYNTYDVAVMNYPLFDKKDVSRDTYELLDVPVYYQQGFEAPIYIHIPFCDSLCDFCIYNRTLTPKDKNQTNGYVECLINEIEMYAKMKSLRNQKVGSVFIGGGTPTVLSDQQLRRIINTIKKCFCLNDCEITVECNPQNTDIEKLKSLKECGVTRISTGVQTFEDTIRDELNIKNSSAYIIGWIEQAEKLHFDDISVDLIYGFPQTNIHTCLSDIEKAMHLKLGHISIYKLTVFAYTKLYKDIINGNRTGLPDDDTFCQMFLQIHNKLLENNFYVQSTQEYSRIGKTVKFWDLTYDGYGDNISFGVSSFGYVNGYCYQNETMVTSYMKKVRDGKLPIQRLSSEITKEQLMERAMVIGLRKGLVREDTFQDSFGMRISDIFPKQIENQITKGLLYENDLGYGLTAKGLYHQGEVCADYMISVFKNVSPLKKKMCIGSHTMP